MAQIKVEVTMDTDQQRIIVGVSRGVTAAQTAVILSQAVTQCLAQDQRERSLLIDVTKDRSIHA